MHHGQGVPVVLRASVPQMQADLAPGPALSPPLVSPPFGPAFPLMRNLDANRGVEGKGGAMHLRHRAVARARTRGAGFVWAWQCIHHGLTRTHGVVLCWHVVSVFSERILQPLHHKIPSPCWLL